MRICAEESRSVFTSCAQDPGEVRIVFASGNAAEAKRLAVVIKDELAATEMTVDSDVAVISLVGSAVCEEIAARAVDLLTRSGVHVKLDQKNGARIALIVEESYAAHAARLLHDEFCAGAAVTSGS